MGKKNENRNKFSKRLGYLKPRVDEKVILIGGGYFIVKNPDYQKNKTNNDVNDKDEK